MPLALVGAIVCYVLAGLYAWPIGFSGNLGRAVALVALGLLLSLVARAAPPWPARRAPQPPE